MKVKLTFFCLTFATLASFSMSGCWSELCYKQYHIKGMVTDSSFNVLDSVKVSVNGFDGYSTTTGIDGTYYLMIPDNERRMSSIDGSYVIFEKSGYSTYVTERFVLQEAGPALCNDVYLQRDAVLQP